MNFSIIIPHYNSVELLERLLASIPVREDLEVLVVDDCSPGNIPQRLSKLTTKYKNLKVFSTHSNSGAGTARNIGLGNAVGKWVLFADSDDIFSPALSSLLEMAIDSDAEVIYFNIKSENPQSISDRTQRYRRNFEVLTSSDPNGVGVRYEFLCPWGKIIRHDFLMRHDIQFQSTRIHNDAMFAAQIGVAAREFQFSPVEGYILTEQPKSVSKVMSVENIATRYIVNRAINRLYARYRVPVFMAYEYISLLMLARRARFDKIAAMIMQNGISLRGLPYYLRKLLKR